MQSFQVRIPSSNLSYIIGKYGNIKLHFYRATSPFGALPVSPYHIRGCQAVIGTLCQLVCTVGFLILSALHSFWLPAWTRESFQVLLKGCCDSPGVQRWEFRQWNSLLNDLVPPTHSCWWTQSQLIMHNFHSRKLSMIPINYSQRI